MPAIHQRSAAEATADLRRPAPDELKAVFLSAKLPPHPLRAHGFSSIGCMPCTTRTKPGEDPRAGRWRDRGKTECGIHTIAIPS